MPSYFNPYFQQQPYGYGQQMPVQQQAPVQQQIQNGGFVSIRNEDEARNYPVALGNSITFKDESAPYIYTKTMGFSQLEMPRFEKYRLVKEDSMPKDEKCPESPNSKSEYDDIKSEIKSLWEEIDSIKDKLVELREEVYKPVVTTSKKKKGSANDDAESE